jgi:modulator of FtsH protease HflK
MISKIINKIMNKLCNRKRSTQTAPVNIQSSSRAQASGAAIDLSDTTVGPVAGLIFRDDDKDDDKPIFSAADFKRGKIGSGGGSGIEDFFRGMTDRPDFLAKIIIVALIISGLLSSYYTVRVEERAVVTRLGKYIETSDAGLHFKIPFGVDVVTLVSTKVQQEAFGFTVPDARSSDLRGLAPFGGGQSSPRIASQTASFRSQAHANESLMLTGDLNVADVQWVVQYRVTNPRDFLFNVADPIKNIRDLSQTSMRRVVGDISINDVLTVGKKDVEDNVQMLMQRTVDDYRMGLSIEGVNLQDVNPPEPVQPSFNLVNSALQEQKQAINRAESEYNQVIPEAEGKAEQQISIAEGFSIALINRARGDSDKFLRMLTEYRKAPDITRTRLYFESLENIFAQVRQITVVDPEVRGVLPLYGQSGEGLAGGQQRASGGRSLSSEPKASASPGFIGQAASAETNSSQGQASGRTAAPSKVR